MMPYEVEWQRVISLVSATSIAVVAGGVVAFRPQARPNRRLALMLLAQAVGLGAGWSLGMMATRPQHAAAWITVGWAAYAALVPLYLLFLATLSTPLVRPLESRPVTYVLWTLAVVGPMLVLARTSWFFQGLEARPGHSTFVQVPGTLGLVLPAIHAIPLPIYGLLASLHQWNAAEAGSLARKQAVAYAMAFGWRDISWLMLLLFLPTVTGSSPTDSDAPTTLIYGVAEFGFMVLVVYGVLSTQLFDIDVKARVVISQSTFVALAGVLFFITAELSERLVSVEGLLPALLWATLIALAFRPLQDFGRRLAMRALPPRSAEDDAARRLQLYQAALSGFQADGEMTAREVAVLARLRERLGLSEAEIGGDSSPKR